MNTAAPRYSLILSAYNSHGTLRRCLESLRHQTRRDFETIVVDSSPGAEGAAIAREYPEVRLIRPGRRLWMHDARNLGAQHARAPRLVFTDPDCVAEPDWLAQLDAAFEAGHRFLGGPIACWPGGVLERAVHIAKFWQWLPGGGSRLYPDVATANMAVERALFDLVGGIPTDNTSGDTGFCVRLRESAGVRPWFVDAARTTHIHEATWRGAFAERFARGHGFAQLRAGMAGWSRGHALVVGLAWPLLALRHLGVKCGLRARRRHLGALLGAWPVVLALDTTWMAGQAAGTWKTLLTGPRAPRSDERERGGAPATGRAR